VVIDVLMQKLNCSFTLLDAVQISMLEYRDKLYNEILKRKKEQRRSMKGREKESGVSSSSRTRSTRHARHSDGGKYR